MVRADNLPSFQRAISESFAPLIVDASHTAPFHARLLSSASEDVAFTEVDAEAHSVDRTAETIERGGSGFYKVSLLLEGTSVLVQDGKELVMRSGDLAVYDTSRPYSLLFTEQFRNLIMMFPKDRLDLPIPFTEQLTAVSLSSHNGLAPILSSFLSQFPSQLTGLPPHVRAKLNSTSLSLVNTLFSEMLDVAAVARDPHQALLQRIYGFIEDRLGDPNLSPNIIADAHYISIRHLHALFAEVDTTVSTVIRQRRLERARKELLDPALADRTVSTIAARCGFVNAAHFSRAFKRGFGMSPSELREP